MDNYGSFDSLSKQIYIKNYVIGSTFDYKIFGDLKFYNLNKYSKGVEDNDNSSVLYFSFLDMNFLFMGDASSAIESKIIKDNKLDVDILKIGHHGSDTSTSLEFLKNVNPKEVVISVGKNNKYGHPSSDVLNRLEAIKIKVRRTDKEGSIKYKKSI